MRRDCLQLLSRLFRLLVEDRGRCWEGLHHESFIHSAQRAVRGKKLWKSLPINVNEGSTTLQNSP